MNAKPPVKGDNVLISDPDFADQCIVRRAGWCQLTYKFKWTTVNPSALVRRLSPGDYLAITVKDSDGKATLYKRDGDGARQTKVTSATTMSH